MPKNLLNRKKRRSALRRWLIAGCWVYGTLLFGWLGLYLLTGDKIPYLALINTLAVYLFTPLPVVMVLAPLLKRREIWVGAAGGLVVFAFLWGGLFFPPRVQSPSGEPVLRVMTFNVLGRHDQTQAIIDVINQADPDIVFLQELNPGLADVLKDTLGARYPYQVLAPRGRGNRDGGHQPITPWSQVGYHLPLEWVGDPQVLTLRWNMEEIALVNFHLFPSGLGTPGGVAYVYRARERQARVLAAYAAHAAAYGPVVMAGDANVTELSTAHQILTMDLFDAWQEVGYGLGHTFPGSDIPGSSRPTLAGYPVPQWLARIDYVLLFLSNRGPGSVSRRCRWVLGSPGRDRRAHVAINQDQPSQVK